MSDDLWNRYQIEARKSRELLAATTRASPLTEFMDLCVPAMLENTTNQAQAVAACLTMWEAEWEATHPGGEVDPYREARTLMRARQRLRDELGD